MKKISIQLAFLLCTNIALISQNVQLKWSSQFQYDNKLDGFFDNYVGTNAKNIYAKFSNLTYTPKKRNNKIKFIAFDKATMKKIGEVGLKGYLPKYESVEYYMTIIFDDVIYALWTRTKKNLTEVYAESFDSDLKRTSPLNKIYEYNSGKSGDIFSIVYNPNIGDRIMMIREIGGIRDKKERDSLRLEYRLINSDFSLVSSKQIALPVLVEKNRGLFSGGGVGHNSLNFTLGDDGNLYIKEMVRLSDEDRKLLKKGESSVYPHLMQVTPENGNLQEYHVRFMKKNTFNFSALITKSGIKLYGFFSDLDKDEKGKDTHGIFYISLNAQTFEPADIKFSYFDKDFLDELYAADKENQKKGKGLFKSGNAKASDEQSIDDNYIIEEVLTEGNDIVLFCTIMRNWTRTVCSTTGNGMRTCQTYYYCTKSNVTAFRLNSGGDIMWAKNLDRTMTYNRWNVSDLNVIRDADNYYVVYGSAYQMNAKKKNRRSTKSDRQLADRLEYATFAVKDGSFKKAEYNVNNFNTKRSEAKYVNPSDIDVYDNQMYTSCSKTRLKPATFIALLCPPVFYFMYCSGNFRQGKGYLGTLSPAVREEDFN